MIAVEPGNVARTGIRITIALATTLAALGFTAPAHGEAEPRAGTFVALTYNVAGLPEQLSGSEPATNSPLISPLLNAYDVVLLQENWSDVLHDQRRAGLVGEEVPRTGYHDLVVADAEHEHQSVPAPSPPPPAIQRVPTGPALTSDGLNRLSRFAFGPLERVMWDECHGELVVEVAEQVSDDSGLEDVLRDAGLGDVEDEVDGGSSDCAAHKGFSVATAQLAPGVEVDIYNLHAEAGGRQASRDASRAGFEQLAEYIRTRSAGRAVVLGGDTNLHTEREDRAFDAETWDRFLATTGLHDVCEVVDCGADAGEIDKFAFRSAADLKIVPQSHHFERERFTRADGEPLSDHDALAVRFHWVSIGRR